MKDKIYALVTLLLPNELPVIGEQECGYGVDGKIPFSARK
jgi:hypothetical protein